MGGGRLLCGVPVRRSRARLVALCGAIVSVAAAATCFAALGRSVGGPLLRPGRSQASAPARSRPVVYGIMDNLLGGMTENAISAATGLKPEEVEVYMSRLKAGTMTLDDYATMMKAMKAAQSLGGAVDAVKGMLGGGVPDDEMTKKLKGIQLIIDSATEEERNSPDLLLGFGKDTQERVKRVSDVAGVSANEVTGFMIEFMGVRSMMNKQMGQGMSIDKAKEEIKKETMLYIEEKKINDSVTGNSRASRRQVKAEKNKTTKKGSKPEWMTV
mmetsp:Transcript_2045/g.7926  ORF Transcript_2045/g.7926 Transcript_2045/m.7926 type:complete len:271 (-) Transcript_2045:312-1124(-)